jgi:GAF domain-containing protein
VDEVAEVILASVGETEADGCLVTSFERISSGAPDSLRFLGVDHPRKTSMFISSLDASRQYEVRTGRDLPLSETVLSLNLLSRFWVVRDLGQEGGLEEDVRALLKAMGVKACVNVPLRTDGRALGQILVLRKRPGTFSDHSMRIFKLLGDQAAVALRRAWVLEEAERRARREELATRAATRMHESLDLRTVLRAAARDIGETLDLAALRVELGPGSGRSERRRAAGSTGSNGGAARSPSGRREGD